MNTQTFTLLSYELSIDQFKALSWLATSLLSLNNDKYEVLNTKGMAGIWYENKESSIKEKTMRIDGMRSTCSIIGIPEELINEVYYNQHRTGLRNFNKLSYIAYFE